MTNVRSITLNILLETSCSETFDQNDLSPNLNTIGAKSDRNHLCNEDIHGQIQVFTFTSGDLK